MFSVASMKAALCKNRQNLNVFKWRWNGWVANKLNTFMWKALDNNLPTLVALKKKRRINIPNTLCSLCGETEEDSDHLFTSCTDATTIWQSINDWCKIPNFFASSIKDLVMMHSYVKTSNYKKKGIQAIIFTAAWCIWKKGTRLFFGTRRQKSTK
ncbi:putative reverse transcriptase zinc-binding domain-containing protein [Helianthus annuus]|nr:putative reverse transcriptase zinc-binding domain-containing protein [Helianthus annuus]